MRVDRNAASDFRKGSNKSLRSRLRQFYYTREREREREATRCPSVRKNTRSDKSAVSHLNCSPNTISPNLYRSNPLDFPLEIQLFDALLMNSPGGDSSAKIFRSGRIRDVFCGQKTERSPYGATITASVFVNFVLRSTGENLLFTPICHRPEILAANEILECGFVRPLAGD